jgi:hypothetical protein
MKNLFLGLMAFVMVTNLTFGQTKEDVRNSKNPYDLVGENHYIQLKTIINSIHKKEITFDEMVKKIKNQQLKYKNNFTQNYLEKNKVYFSKSVVDLKEILVLEEQLINDVQLKDKEGLLEYFAILKWSVFLNEDLELEAQGCLSCWEACTDRCMRAKLKAIFDSNWIEQAAFIFSAPESTAVMYAACAWDCTRSTSSH